MLNETVGKVNKMGTLGALLGLVCQNFLRSLDQHFKLSIDIDILFQKQIHITSISHLTKQTHLNVGVGVIVVTVS